MFSTTYMPFMRKCSRMCDVHTVELDMMQRDITLMRYDDTNFNTVSFHILLRNNSFASSQND